MKCVKVVHNKIAVDLCSEKDCMNPAVISHDASGYPATNWIGKA